MPSVGNLPLWQIFGQEADRNVGSVHDPLENLFGSFFETHSLLVEQYSSDPQHRLALSLLKQGIPLGSQDPFDEKHCPDPPVLVN